MTVSYLSRALHLVRTEIDKSLAERCEVYDLDAQRKRARREAGGGRRTR